MRDVQSVGRPGTAVIPPYWGEAPGIVMSGTWTALCAISEPATEGEYDEDLGYSPQTPGATIYAGPCSIEARPVNDRANVEAGQEVTTQDYLVVVPLSVDPQPDYLVMITGAVRGYEADVDPKLIGKTLTVRSVAYGSTAWERDLTCTLDLG
jgi:hypothetical protein